MNIRLALMLLSFSWCAHAGEIQMVAPAGAQAPFALSKALSADHTTLTFNLPGGAAVTMPVTQSTRYGAQRWIGQVGGDYLVLVSNGASLSGSLHVNGESFTIAGSPERAVLFSQAYGLKASRFGNGTPTEASDAVAAPGPEPKSSVAPAKTQAAPTFDILMFYSKALADQEGLEKVDAAALDQFAYLETAFQNGQIGYQPNLVGFEPYVVDESQTYSQMLDTFAHDQAVLDRMSAYGADDIALLRAPDPADTSAAGMGYQGRAILDAQGNPTGHLTVGRGLVIDSTQADNLAHEVGHNLGANHPYGASYGSGPGWKPYAAGHACGASHGDIMSGPEFGPTAPWYSTSRVAPAIPTDLSPCGTADDAAQPADNERAIREALPDGVAVGTPAAPDGTVTMTASSVQVNDSAGTVVVTITRTGTLSAGRQINFVTSNGTGLAGTDYAWTSGNIQMAAGQSQANITIPVMKRASHHGDVTFNVTLRYPLGVSIGSTAMEVITVKDTNPVPPPPPPPASSSGGGGAFGLWSVLAMGLGAGFRLRRGPRWRPGL